VQIILLDDGALSLREFKDHVDRIFSAFFAFDVHDGVIGEYSGYSPLLPVCHGDRIDLDSGAKGFGKRLGSGSLEGI